MKYIRKVSDLTTGASLGNLLAFARFDPETNLEGLWSSMDNSYKLGRWRIEFFEGSCTLEPKETIFEPLSQSTIYQSDGLIVVKKSFLPYARPENFERFHDDLRNLFYFVTVRNLSGEEKKLTVKHKITLPAVESPYFTKQPPLWEMDRKFSINFGGNFFEISDLSNSDKCFLFSDINFEVRLISEREIETEQVLHVKPGEGKEAVIIFRFGDTLRSKMQEIFSAVNEIKSISEMEIEFLIKTANVFTPDEVINRGIKWAKVNMARVQHLYKNGFAFTNDPPQDIVVMRDLAWFILGCDYVSHYFSHKLVEFSERYGFHSNGKVTEYVHANEENPELHDYGLNINDDTPLLVWAIYHHCLVCDDENFLTKAYALMKKACDYILTQIRDGLVFSSASGTGVYGIASWRNIVEGYNLSGYVSEINAESIFAFELVSRVADRLCRKEEAQRYKMVAEMLRKNFNDKLVDKDSGLPLLNIDQYGNEHRDVTGDMVFPLIFKVVEDGSQRMIAKELTQSDIWTGFGARTVSRAESYYDPDFGYQLVGGVWPNLTAWIGFGVREIYSDKVAEALRNIYKFVEVDVPKFYGNVVPGEFPERLHGENFSSRGMTLSPWVSPTYIWLIIEGLVGIEVNFDDVVIKPSLPRGWRWIAVNNLPLRGERFDFFIFDGELFIDIRFRDIVRYDGRVNFVEMLDCKVFDNERIFAKVFEIDGRVKIFVGSDSYYSGEVEVFVSGQGVRFNVELSVGEARVMDLSDLNLTF